MSDNAALTRGSLWLSLGTSSVRLFPLALLWLVLRSSAPAEYGVYSLANGVVAVAALVAESGITLTVTSTARLTREEEEAIAAYALRSGAIYFTCCCLAAMLFSLRSGFGTLLPYTAVLATPILLTGWWAVIVGRLQRSGQYRLITFYQSIGSAVALLAGLVIWLTVDPIWALIAQAALSTGGTYLIFICSPQSRIRPRGARSLSPALRSALRSSMGSNLIGILGRRTDDVFVGLFLGPAALAQYAFGYRMLMIGTEVFMHSSERVSTAQLGVLHGTRIDRWKQADNNQRHLSSTLAPAFVVLGVSLYWLIPRVIGPQWHTAAQCALILCFAGSIQTLFNLTYSSIYVISGAAAALRYQARLIPCVLVPTLAGIPLGVVGAAAGYFLGSTFGLLVSRRLRRSEFSPAHAGAADGHETGHTGPSLVDQDLLV